MSNQSVKKSKSNSSTVPHLIVKAEEMSQEKTDIPIPTNTSIEAILAKRKAEKLLEPQPLSTTCKPENVVQPIAKLNVLEARMRQLKDNNDPSDTALLQSFPETSPLLSQSNEEQLKN